MARTLLNDKLCDGCKLIMPIIVNSDDDVTIACRRYSDCGLIKAYDNSALKAETLDRIEQCIDDNYNRDDSYILDSIIDILDRYRERVQVLQC